LETLKKEQQTPSIEVIRAGKPSAFDVQRSLFDVSNETGETPVPLLNLGGTGFQPVVSGVTPETGTTSELQLWFDDTDCVPRLATPSGV